MAQESQTSSNVDVDTDSDGHLIGLVRSGDVAAFDGLYERHVSIASTVARRNVDNPSDAEDVVADAFQSVLQSLVVGKGPDTFFRAYLLSTVTRLSHQRNRKAGKVLPSGDESVLDQTLAESDAAISAFESDAVAKAFRTLPERWQAVLWYLDVERMKPAVVAPILGLSPNAVSALALRAREGLRRQYLQSHIADQPDTNCAEFLSKLGSFLRGGLSNTTDRKVREHLKGCSLCTATLAELKDVEGTMRGVLLPLVTGISAAMWAGKGAGLGVLGGIVPAKAALAVPALPAIMAVLAAAGVGLALGAAGIVNQLTQDSTVEQLAAESSSMSAERDAVQEPSPSESTNPPAPADPPAPTDPPEPPIPPAPALVEEPPIDVAPVPAAQETSPAPPALPTPLHTPVATPSPRPSVAPAPASPVVVSGSARRAWREQSSGTTVEVDFAVSGTRPLGSGKAVFTVGQNAWLVEDSFHAPDGWICTLENRSILTCVTDSVKRDDLHFHVAAMSKRIRGDRVLTYSLSGPGFAPKDFTYSY